MKNLLFLAACLVLIAGIIFFLPHEKNSPVSPVPKTTEVPTRPVVAGGTEKVSLFVPYWSVAKGIDADTRYDQLIYFGIAPTQTGIDEQEAGFLQVKTFAAMKPAGVSSVLALRMLDSDVNFAVLKDPVKQKAVISKTLAVAKANGFSGVMLDLEMSALPFDSLIKQVNAFAQTFSREAKADGVTFSMSLYGDTFYRIRPFEVKTLAAYADHIYIMAYDFSKANGNPGPNFPLTGKSIYGYDYAKLTDNFLQVVPNNKLSVIFGLYGYDWTVDEKNIAQKIGKAKSLVEIEQQIVAECAALHCEKHRDNASAETTIHYTDADGNKHVVWYEDMESVRQKEVYLKSRGITSYSLWANSYF
jgi:spore germination protein YaaH